MDSGNISEVEDKVEQPVEAVAAETEVKLDEPQSSESETEFFIEEEGSQQDEPKEDGMTEEQRKAAFRQEREKRKKKAKQNQELQERLEAQAKELEELKKTVSSVTKGPRPSPLDYTNDDEFYADLEKWNGVVQPKETKQTAEVAPIELSVDQEYHLHKTEEALKKSFPDYEDVEATALSALKEQGIDPKAGMNELVSKCHELDLDTAKVKYALGRFPDFAGELKKAAMTNQSALNTVLRTLEKKVQARTKKKIESEPEPKTKSTGSVDVKTKHIEEAKAAWLADPTLENHKKYRAAKNN